MNRADLYRSFSEIDDDILERSERATGSERPGFAVMYPLH